MAEAHLDTAATTDMFRAVLAGVGVALPLAETDAGVIVDATGQQIFVVDPDNLRPDSQVHAIAAYLIAAVNTCGGCRVTHEGAH